MTRDRSPVRPVAPSRASVEPTRSPEPQVREPRRAWGKRPAPPAPANPPPPRFDVATLPLLHDAPDRAQSGPRRSRMPLPYRREMERSFGRSLDDVTAYTGRSAELRRFGAQALTVGNAIVFAKPDPSPALVAHETAHVLQNRNAGAAALAAGSIAPRHSRAEAEADHVSALVAAHGVGVPLPAITATAAAHIHLAPDPAAHVDVEKPLVVDLVDGDPFRVTIVQNDDPIARITTLEIDVDYVGSDDVGSHRVSYSILLPAGRRPDAVLRKRPSHDWKSLEIDLYGDGRHVTTVTHAVMYMDGWSPRARQHTFTATGPGIRKTDEVVVKSRYAVPAAIASAKLEGLPPGAPVKAEAEPTRSLPSDTAAIAAKRLLDDLVNQVPHAGLGQLQRRVTADHARHASAQRGDPAAAVRLSRLIAAIQAVEPMMKALQLASDRQAYLDDIAGDAIRLVSDVKQLYGAALEEVYDAGTDKKMTEAHRAFDAVWYRIAWLYVESDRGVSKLIRTASFAVHEVPRVRQRTGRGQAFWPLLERLLGVPSTTPAAQTVVAHASAKALDARAEFLAGKTGSLAKVTEAVEDAQVVIGLSGLLAANESFHAFKKDMAGLVGRAFNRLGQDLSDVCSGYITRFEAILTRTEAAIPRTGIREVGKAAIGTFQAIVVSPQFKSDVEDIQSRVQWIQAIELLGKILAVIGAAALTGGAAGAAVGAMLEGAGASAGIVAVGGFAAEVVTFTIVSRLGNQAVFGRNDTSFTEDLITNALMFGFLKAATAGYGRLFKLVSNPKAHKTAYAVGAGVTGLVALQVFADAHHLVKEGKWMTWGDRGRALVQNATMLVALGLGSYLTRPLAQRIRNDVLVFTAKHFPGRLEKIGSKIAEVQSALAALAKGDPAAAQAAPELVQRIERIWNEELTVLAEATRRERTPQAQKAFAEVVRSYVKEIAKLELQLALGGLEVELGAERTGNTFRPISPGFVAFKAEGKEVLEAFHQQNRGSFEKINDDLYAGRVGGEQTFYVPEHSVKKLLLDIPDAPGLRDAEARTPKVDATTDPQAFAKDARAQAKNLGKVVPGPLGATLAEIEGRALAADIQIEVGLRILDPVFGENSSDALMAAKLSIAAEPNRATQARDAKALGELREASAKLQKQMLDVLRNPALDIKARRSALHKLLVELERKVKGTSHLKPEAFDFAEARTQIDALREETFKDLTTVDASGNLTQNGMKAGTLSGLMAKIKAINNLFRKHGVARELALSVSTPRDPASPREVKVLSRTPRQAPPATRKPPSPVDPTDPTTEGIVVDIGVGLSDYARDVGGETGELVKTEYGSRYADPAMTRRDLTWEHTGPRLDVDSVLVLGDALQTLPMMFGTRSVKRMFINHINANYDVGGASYKTLATGLGKVMARNGRVEVQWSNEPETTGGVTVPRGHITGEALHRALDATGITASRRVMVTRDARTVTEFDYSIEASRRKSGTPGRTPPSNPVPQFRWIFTFGD